MWSHSQQWPSVPFWSELHCYWSSLDLHGLRLVPRYQDVSGLLWLRLSVRFGCNTPREIYDCSAARLLFRRGGCCCCCASMFLHTWTWGTSCSSQKAGGQIKEKDEGQEVEEETEFTSGPAGYLLSVLSSPSLHPPLSPPYSPLSSQHTPQTPASLSTFNSTTYLPFPIFVQFTFNIA